MISVIQRVSQASVTVDGTEISRISLGMLVLAAVHRNDTPADIAWTARKLTSLRIFPGPGGNFDQDVSQIGGSILLVSNFTVAADARKGRRPSLETAADPALGRTLFDALVAAVAAYGVNLHTGRFGADMKISLVNEGPATFILDSQTGSQRSVES